MRGHNQGKAGIHPCQFLNHDRILDVAQSGTAIFFGKNDTEQSKAGCLLHGIQGKLLRFVPGEDMGLEFRGSEISHHLAQFVLLFGKGKLHGSFHDTKFATSRA